MASFEPVRAVQRGLEVLRIVSEEGPITISGIVARSRMAQPTVVRMLETLAHDGYIYRQSGKATYVVAGRTLTLSSGFDARSQLVEVATPIVDRLHVAIGWPSNLAVFDRDAMVIVYSNRAALGLSVPSRLGARLPLLATGIGMVALAHLPASERDDALQLAAKSGDRWSTEMRLLIDLPARLEEIRRSGHAFADEEYLDSKYQSLIWAVAVPILSSSGEIIAAISSLVLRNAGRRQNLLAAILPELNAAAMEIGRVLDADKAIE